MGVKSQHCVRLFGRASILTLTLCVASGATAAAEQAEPTQEEIIVVGQRNAVGLRANSEIDENGIAAYGVDTVGDLLGAIATETDPSGDGPVILINGQLASGIDDISDLPTEAVSKIQLLSRDAASALGQRPTRRVVNVVIKPNHRQATLNATGRLATAGGGRQGEGHINLLKLDNGNRQSLALRLTSTDRLYESDRDMLSAVGPVPFDPAGNILSFPLTGGEIDPVLSALAGGTVLVAGVPTGTGTPTLADFVGSAGLANASDLGRFRTLIPHGLVASANANLTRKFGAHTASLTVRGERQEFNALTGAATAALRLPATSPFSPFSRDVTLATVVGPPLEQHARLTTITAAAVANGPLGKWRYAVNGNINWRLARTVSDRGYDFDVLQTGVDSGTVNPFLDIEPALLGTALSQRSRTRSLNSGLLATLNGSPFKLPAGPAHAAARLEWRGNRAISTTTGPSPSLSRRLNRDEVVGQLTLQLPLVSSKSVGEFSGELSGALRHVTASGTLHDIGYALNWRPDDRFSLRAAVNHEQIAPPPNALTDPVVTIDNVRIFDFIRQETVLVTYLTGGNPDLDIERRRTLAIGATWRPFDKADLNLAIDYLNIVGRDAFAALPPVNGDVQAAFPDRFQRDADGRLIAVDARPVPFELVRRQELRSGATFNRRFGGTSAKPSGEGGIGRDEDGGALGSGWRVNAFVTHSWTLQSERQARSGLPVIDLLSGGALGYGGGQPRHRLQFGGGVVHQGVGLQMQGNWTGSSRIAAGTVAAPDELRFASQMLLDARLFANLGSLMPERPWTKNARITLSAENVFDSQRRVRDRSGETPLGYQRYLLDPLGRTVSLSLRKAF